MRRCVKYLTVNIFTENHVSLSLTTDRIRYKTHPRFQIVIIFTSSSNPRQTKNEAKQHAIPPANDYYHESALRDDVTPFTFTFTNILSAYL